jgi:hypothetical protein
VGDQVEGKKEDEQYLQALLEVLREEDGKLLRSLLKSLSKNKDPSAKRLAEVLIQHPLLRDLVPH